MHLVPSSKSGAEEEGFTIIVLSKDRKQKKQTERGEEKGRERKRGGRDLTVSNNPSAKHSKIVKESEESEAHRPALPVWSS